MRKTLQLLYLFVSEREPRYLHTLNSLTNYLSIKNPNIKLAYSHVLHPRNIAHQILTIREDICGELIGDLRSISLENTEIQRYCVVKMSHGGSVADQGRRMTRSDDHEESTPLRNKNYYECAIYITNFAIDLVKMQSAKSAQALKFLDENVAALSHRVAAMEPLDRFLHASKGPCALLEELYYHGISQGVVVTDSGENLNSLKIAQDIMAFRLALATEASRVLADLATNSRQYYKMIKVQIS